MVVGITGGIGSGKSTVVSMFSKFENVAIYVADNEAKNLINSSNSIRNQLISAFSSEAYNENGLNRAFLAKIVFQDKEKLALLNSIVHPVVHEHLHNFIEENRSKNYILYENAILFENGSDTICDKIITVTAPIETRIKRVISRDNTTEESVKNRMKNQWNDIKKIYLSNYIIENLDLNQTEKQVFHIHKKLTEKPF